MAIKIESAKIKLNGKEYTFLKPTAVEVIELQDSCLTTDGTDVLKYANGLLKWISKDLSIQEFVQYNKKEVELTNGETLILPEMKYEEWFSSISKYTSFSRVNYAKEALKSLGVEGNIDLSNYSYDDISGLGLAYIELYDDSELKKVIEQIEDCCFR